MPRKEESKERKFLKALHKVLKDHSATLKALTPHVGGVDTMVSYSIEGVVNGASIKMTNDKPTMVSAGDVKGKITMLKKLEG